jgi:hypothetical protein
MAAAAAPPPSQEDMLLTYSDFAKLARTFGEVELRGRALKAQFEELLRSSGRSAAGEQSLPFDAFYAWWLARQAAAGGTGKLLERASAKLAAIAAGTPPPRGGPQRRPRPRETSSAAEAPSRVEAAAAGPRQIAARKPPVARRSRSRPAQPAAAESDPDARRPAWKTAGAVPRSSSPQQMMPSVRGKPTEPTPATGRDAPRVSPADWQRPWRTARAPSPAAEAEQSAAVRGAAETARAAPGARASRPSRASPQAVPRRTLRSGSPRRRAPAWRSSLSPDPRAVSPERETAALPRRIRDDDAARSRKVTQRPTARRSLVVDEYRAFLRQIGALAHETALARVGAHSLETMAALSTMQLIDAGIGLQARNRIREALAAKGVALPPDDRSVDLVWPDGMDSEGEDALPAAASPVSWGSGGRIRVMHRSPSQFQSQSQAVRLGVGAGDATLQGRRVGGSPTRSLAHPSTGTTPQHREQTSQPPFVQALVDVDDPSQQPQRDLEQAMPDLLRKAGWEVHFSRTTRQRYYFNSLTGESTYSMPSSSSSEGAASVPTTRYSTPQRDASHISSERGRANDTRPAPLSAPAAEGAQPQKAAAGATDAAAADVAPTVQEEQGQVRQALAEIAALIAQHPENDELLSMMVETTAALAALDEQPEGGIPETMRVAVVKTALELEPEPVVEANVNAETCTDVDSTDVERHAVTIQSYWRSHMCRRVSREMELLRNQREQVLLRRHGAGAGAAGAAAAATAVAPAARADAPAATENIAATAHLAALTSLLEEKQAALTALLRETDTSLAGESRELEDLLKQVEALDALLGS